MTIVEQTDDYISRIKGKSRSYARKTAFMKFKGVFPPEILKDLMDLHCAVPKTVLKPKIRQIPAKERHKYSKHNLHRHSKFTKHED